MEEKRERKLLHLLRASVDSRPQRRSFRSPGYSLDSPNCHWSVTWDKVTLEVWWLWSRWLCPEALRPVDEPGVSWRNSEIPLSSLGGTRAHYSEYSLVNSSLVALATAQAPVSGRALLKGYLRPSLKCLPRLWLQQVIQNHDLSPPHAYLHPTLSVSFLLFSLFF